MAGNHYVFQCGHVAEKPKILKRFRDPISAILCWGKIRDVVLFEINLPLGRWYSPGDDIDQSSFSLPLGPITAVIESAATPAETFPRAITPP